MYIANQTRTAKTFRGFTLSDIMIHYKEQSSRQGGEEIDTRIRGKKLRVQNMPSTYSQMVLQKQKANLRNNSLYNTHSAGKLDIYMQIN